MQWVQLEGWPLANSRSHGTLKDEDKQTFYVNVDAPGTLSPAHRGDRDGFLFEYGDKVWFLETPLDVLSQMVRGWEPGPSA